MRIALWGVVVGCSAVLIWWGVVEYVDWHR